MQQLEEVDLDVDNRVFALPRWWVQPHMPLDQMGREGRVRILESQGSRRIGKDTPS